MSCRLIVYGSSGDGVFGSNNDAGGGVGVVTALKPKEPILWWTQFPTHTPFMKSL